MPNLNNRSYWIGADIGGISLSLAIVASYVSASSFIGGPSAAYRYGLSWVMLTMVQVPIIFLSLGVLGKKLILLSHTCNALTINDLLHYKYRSRYLVSFTSIGILFAYMCSITAQFVGGARIIQNLLDFPYLVSLVIFGTAVISYTSLGGWILGIITDIVQSMVMFFGATTLLLFIVQENRGLKIAISKLKEIDPKLVSPPWTSEEAINASMIMYFIIVVCLGTLGLPGIARSCLAVKNTKSLKVAMIFSTVLLSTIMLFVSLSGALGRALLPNLPLDDQAILTIAKAVLPAPLLGMFLASLVAAVMSTVNAQVLQASSTIVKDILYKPLFKMCEGNDKKMLKISQTITLALGLVMVLLASNPPKMIIWLNLFSLGALESLFIWPILLGLYWSKANAKGAILSSISGLFSYLFCFTIYDHYKALIIALPIGLAMFIFGSLIPINKAHR